MTEKKQIPGLPFGSDITDLAKNYRFSSSEILLLHTLRSGMNPENKKNWRAQGTLALEMKCTRPTVVKAVAGLRQKNIITCEIQKNLNFAYRIIFPFKPKADKILNKRCKDSLQLPDKNLNKRCDNSLQVPVKILATNNTKEVVKGSSQDKSSSSIAKKKKKKISPKIPSKKTKSENKELELFPEKVSLAELKEKFGFNYGAFNLTETASKEKVINLGYFLSFFEDQKIYPVSPSWNDQMSNFISDVLHTHWSREPAHQPGSGIRMLLNKFCLCGAAYHFGFDPKTEEQIEAEKVRMEKEKIEDAKTQLAEEEQERAHAIEQHERRMEREKRVLVKLKVSEIVEDFIHEPSVRAFLEHKSGTVYGWPKCGIFDNSDDALEWIRLFKERNGLRSGDDIIELCERRMRLRFK